MREIPLYSNITITVNETEAEENENYEGLGGHRIYLNCTYQQMVDLLGKPTFRNDEYDPFESKTSVGWTGMCYELEHCHAIDCDDLNIFAWMIVDWKRGFAPEQNPNQTVRWDVLTRSMYDGLTLQDAIQSKLQEGQRGEDIE